jgi:hypothetical protein
MKNKINFLFLGLFILFFYGNAHAETGAGIILGEPSGFSIKHILQPKFALDGALGYSFTNALDIHADFLILFPGLFKENDLFFYFGGGMKMRFHQKKEENNRVDKYDSFVMGPRFPLGISYKWQMQKLEFFFELAFILEIIPDIDPAFDGGIGVRYYFN